MIAAEIETITVSDAQKRFTSIVDGVTQDETRTIKVTRHGEAAAAILSWEAYECLIETIEVMSDPALMANIREGVRDAHEGRTLSAAEVAARLGIEA